jgi:hypothetical protein
MFEAEESTVTSLACMSGDYRGKGGRAIRPSSQGTVATPGHLKTNAFKDSK